MRVFLDECVDWRLARHIIGHEIKTARQMAWTAIQNGALLALASGQFDAFVTVDRNLAYQRNVSAHPIAIVVLRARTNRLADLLPLAPMIVSALDTAPRGAVTIIGEVPAKD